MLRTGEFEITDVCPKTFEAVRTRMHNETRPGDIRKVAGDPLDDVADETRYALYSFIQQSEKPREERLREAVEGLDLTAAPVRWQQRLEEIDEEEGSIRVSSRLSLGRRFGRR
jgi:hypothetical protein